MIADERSQITVVYVRMCRFSPGRHSNSWYLAHAFFKNALGVVVPPVYCSRDAALCVAGAVVGEDDEDDDAAAADEIGDGPEAAAGGAGGDIDDNVRVPRVGQKRPWSTGAVCGAPLKSGSGQMHTVRNAATF